MPREWCKLSNSYDGAYFLCERRFAALIALIYTHRLIFDAISEQGVHAEAHISA
jgi:hypothetical protein